MNESNFSLLHYVKYTVFCISELFEIIFCNLCSILAFTNIFWALKKDVYSKSIKNVLQKHSFLKHHAFAVTLFSFVLQGEDRRIMYL